MTSKSTGLAEEGLDQDYLWVGMDFLNIEQQCFQILLFKQQLSPHPVLLDAATNNQIIHLQFWY